jgi:hypothetical protein
VSHSPIHIMNSLRIAATAIFWCGALFVDSAEPNLNTVYISEFMAVNGGAFPDREGEYVDWLELHNPTEETVTLTGWYLTDDPDVLTKFQVPTINIHSGAYRLVFVSGKEGNSPFIPEIHTNFSLRGGGEYLALVEPDGQTIVHAFDPYPPQSSGVSYGVRVDDVGETTVGAFRAATPNKANGVHWLGKVADTKFSVDRGVFVEPFEVTITTATEGAQILYTLDGREPSLGSLFIGAVGEVLKPGRSIAITTTTTLRAIAIKDGHLSSNIDTQTYLFPQHVTDQPDAPEGFSDTWRGADYGMDQDPEDLPLIAGDEELSAAEAKAVIADALQSLPSLSLVLPVESMFGRAKGIYHNTEDRGLESERAASVELIHPDGKKGFQVNAGLRIQGFTSRDPGRNPKHSLRLLFKERYGASKLRYPLFGDDAVREFDTLVLRSNSQDAWVYDSPGNRLGQFVRDEWNRRTQQAMGWPACHGTWVHLYINGLYWGVYNPTERPDASFMASYYGGSADDWDVVKNHEEIIRGDGQAFTDFLEAVQVDANRFSAGYRDFSSNEAYLAISDHLDVPSMIDYMIHNMYSAAQDWPGNYYMGRDRTGASGGFKCLSWDNEHGMKSAVTEDRTRPHSRDNDSPTKFHHPLKDNEEYRLLFGDHLHRAFFNGGVLAVDKAEPEWDPEHPSRNLPAALWMEITNEIETALIAESARWGDYRRATPYTVAKDFQDLRESLLENWFPQRSEIVLDQFRDQGVYPEIEAPVFSEAGGRVDPGTFLNMRSKHMAGLFTPFGGKAYYTVDGSDPRLFGGELSKDAMKYEAPIPLVESVTVRARLLRDDEWSALNEVSYWIDSEPASSVNVILTTIHYRPSAPSQKELAEGIQSASAFEFVELMNVGPLTVDFRGTHFTAGIQFNFDQARITELAPGERMFVVNNRTAFEQRYGRSSEVAGAYTASRLDNDGERLRLVDRDSETIVEVSYQPIAPWPSLGLEQALHLKDPSARIDLNDPGLWHAAPANSDASTPASFEQWMRERGLTDANEDPDGNGLSHLVEYALGLDLKEGLWAEISFGEDDAILITHHARVASGYSFALERSSDLVLWEMQPSALAGQQFVDPSLEVRTLELLERDVGKPFYRLKMEPSQ